MLRNVWFIKINKNYIYLYSVEGDLFLDMVSLGYSKYTNSLLENNEDHCVAVVFKWGNTI